MKLPEARPKYSARVHSQNKKVTKGILRDSGRHESLKILHRELTWQPSLVSLKKREEKEKMKVMAVTYLQAGRRR